MPCSTAAPAKPVSKKKGAQASRLFLSKQTAKMAVPPFFTPKSIVSLIVEMIEPYQGRVYDPAM